MMIVVKTSTVIKQGLREPYALGALPLGQLLRNALRMTIVTLESIAIAQGNQDRHASAQMSSGPPRLAPLTPIAGTATTATALVSQARLASIKAS